MKPVVVFVAAFLAGLACLACYMPPPAGPDVASVTVVCADKLSAQIARIDGKGAIPPGDDVYRFKPGLHKLGVNASYGGKMARVYNIDLNIPAPGKYRWTLAPKLSGTDLIGLEDKLEPMP